MQALTLLARQNGLITRQQARAVGMSDSAVTRRLQSKEWRQVLPGVFRHTAVNVSDLLMVDATMLWLGPKAVLSGSWAAWWHELRVEPAGPVSVTMPLSSGARSWRDVRVRRRNLSPADTTVVRGTSVIRRPLAALENARLPAGQDVVDRALQRHVSVAELDAAMSRFSNAVGAAAAREALSLVRDGTVSPPERLLAAAFRRAGLHQVKAGVHIWLDGRRFWLDFAVEQLQLAIEVDGVSTHTQVEVFTNDRVRQNALVKANWTVLRYTPGQISADLPGIVAEVAAVLANLGR